MEIALRTEVNGLFAIKHNDCISSGVKFLPEFDLKNCNILSSCVLALRLASFSSNPFNLFNRPKVDPNKLNQQQRIAMSTGNLNQAIASRMNQGGIASTRKK